MKRKETEELALMVLSQLKKKRAFFESPEFNRLIDLFQAEVEKRGGLDQASIEYAKPGQYPFTATEFKHAFESVAQYAPGQVEDRSGLSPALKTEYRGLVFTVLLGQGSAYFVTKNTPT